MRWLLSCLCLLFLSFGTETLPSYGEKAPDFVLYSPKGKKIKLSKLRGKVVLIDFWASWCGPCRKENPNVVEAYKKYRKSKFKNGNGFEIISVSLDRQKDKWIQAIEHDNLMWKNHAWDKDGMVSKLYKVSTIPTAFLIDGDGRIVASRRQLRGLGLHLELDKLLE